MSACDCGLVQVYGGVPWGVSHAVKCSALTGPLYDRPTDREQRIREYGPIHPIKEDVVYLLGVIDSLRQSRRP